MDLEAKKISFVQEFLRLENEENFKPITMEQYNAEIDQAMEDSKNGRMIETTELKAKIHK